MPRAGSRERASSKPRLPVDERAVAVEGQDVEVVEIEGCHVPGVGVVIGVIRESHRPIRVYRFWPMATSTVAL